MLMQDERTRLVILGVDGLPLELAQQLCAQYPELFPNLTRVLPEATSVQAELPELSPVNWSSFATGCGPEEHGVLGFTRLDPASYAIQIADTTWLRTPTIFERLGEQGLVSRVLNLPNMYPARPIRGMMVAGFVAPELSRAVFPPFLAGQLASMGYRIEADTDKGRHDPDFLLAELRTTLAGRRKALELFWGDLAWDVLVFVLTETDRLFHFHFPALTSADDMLHRPCLEFMAMWDAAIGDLLDRYEALPEPKRLLVLADHGFGELEQELDLNVWLKGQGLLHCNTSAHELDASAILPETKAFALDPGRVFLHDQRFGRGRVFSPAARESTLAHIREGLMSLRHEGRAVMQSVRTGGELYPGAPDSLQLPDLIFTPAPGFDLKAKFDRSELFGRFGRRGTHRPEGAFFYDSQGAQPERMRDVGRLILKHFDIQQPESPAKIIISHAH